MTRLLSPMKRRIYPNARTGAGMETGGSLVQKLRNGLKVGEGDATTRDALRRLGWVDYDGPGQTDERGYIIPGTDIARGL